MDVIEPGQFVTIAGGLKAQVTTTLLRPSKHVMYEVAWWTNGSRLSAYIEAFEIESNSPPKTVQIGFENN